MNAGHSIDLDWALHHLRRAALAALATAAAACGGASSGEHSAAERARAEQRASGEQPVEKPKGVSWSGWRYQGAREDCFFVVGRTCFKSQADACAAAKCAARACKVEGGGPATVSCR